MLLRRIMLALGAVALIVGVGLLVLWMRESSQQVSARRANLPQQSVLVAARPIPTGTLLRAPDIMWRAMPPAEVPPNGYLRAKSSEGELIGAVVTRSYRQGEAFTSDLLVKPSEPGFLPAVLAPGMRAVSIAVGVAEGTSGLIAPGDRVDVILTQVFQDPSISVTQRSVGETVLRNLRVIAIDQSINPTGKPEQSSVRSAASSQPRVPKTVTLEVNSRQAETLMVANQLGKIELALRSLNEPPPGLAGPATDEPTWAAEVSPALSDLNRVIRRSSEPRRVASAAPPLARVQVLRGSKAEWHCFDERGRAVSACGPAAAAVPERAPSAIEGGAPEASTSEGPAPSSVPTE